MTLLWRSFFLLACIHLVTSCRADWIIHPSTSLGSFGSSKQAAPCMQARIKCSHLFYLGIDDFGSSSCSAKELHGLPLDYRHLWLTSTEKLFKEKKVRRWRFLTEGISSFQIQSLCCTTFLVLKIEHFLKEGVTVGGPLTCQPLLFTAWKRWTEKEGEREKTKFLNYLQFSSEKIQPSP